MLGVGIDSVDIPRFRETVRRTPSLKARVLTPDELAYTDGQVDGVPSMAVRFAAKEAAMKALSVGLGAFSFQDIEVVRTNGGAPELRVTAAASDLMGRRGVARLLVSLTHTSTTATAIVVAE